MSYGFNKQDPIKYPRVQGSDWNALVDYVTGSLSGSGTGSGWDGQLSPTGSYVVGYLTGSALSGSQVYATGFYGNVATINNLVVPNNGGAGQLMIQAQAKETIAGGMQFSAGSWVSGSDVIINLATTGSLSATNASFTTLSSSSITGSSASFSGTITGSSILASNITASGNVSGSVVRGSNIFSPYISGSTIIGDTITSPTAGITNLTATNIKATNITGSNIISGSNIYGANAIITNVTSTTENVTNVNAIYVTGSNTVSGSTLLGNTITGRTNVNAPYITGSAFTGSTLYMSGQTTVGGLQVNGTVNATGAISGSSLTTNGNIAGANVTASGIISGSSYQNLPTSTAGGSGSFNALTVTGSGHFTGDLTVDGNLTSQTLTYTDLIITNVVAVNVTGSNQVSGSNIYGQNANIQAIYGQNVSGSTLSGSTSISSPIGNLANVNAVNVTATGIISGSTIQGAFSPANIVATNVTGSTNVSGSNIYGATGKITNLTTTNVTGSNIVSGSNIYGQNATITNIYAGTVSGSNGIFGTVTYTNIAAGNISGSGEETLNGNLYVKGAISGSSYIGITQGANAGIYYSNAGFISGYNGMTVSTGLGVAPTYISVVPSGSAPIEFSIAPSGSDGFYIYHTAGVPVSFWWGASAGTPSLNQANKYMVYSGSSGIYYAKNGSTGNVDYSGSDAGLVINYALNGTGSSVFVNQGAFMCWTPIVMYPESVLYGTGPDTTLLIATGSAPVVISGSTPALFTWGCQIRDLRVDGGNVANYGIYWTGSNCALPSGHTYYCWLSLSNLNLRRTNAYPIFMWRVVGENTITYFDNLRMSGVILLYGVSDSNFNNIFCTALSGSFSSCHMTNAYLGGGEAYSLCIYGGSSSYPCEKNIFTSIRADNPSRNALLMKNYASENIFVGCVFSNHNKNGSSNTYSAVKLQDTSQRNIFQGCLFVLDETTGSNTDNGWKYLYEESGSSAGQNILMGNVFDTSATVSGYWTGSVSGSTLVSSANNLVV